MKQYKAIYLSDGYDPKLPLKSRGGFENKEEAEKYIASQLCDSCKVNCDKPKDSPCRAEWHIEEYEDSKDVGDF